VPCDAAPEPEPEGGWQKGDVMALAGAPPHRQSALAGLLCCAALLRCSVAPCRYAVCDCVTAVPADVTAHARKVAQRGGYRVGDVVRPLIARMGGPNGEEGLKGFVLDEEGVVHTVHKTTIIQSEDDGTGTPATVATALCSCAVACTAPATPRHSLACRAVPCRAVACDGYCITRGGPPPDREGGGARTLRRVGCVVQAGTAACDGDARGCGEGRPFLL
jgi:hypothetical protein